jgi:PmbA protein
MNAKEIVNLVLKEAKRFNVDDAASIASTSHEDMMRFSNNSITIVKSLRNTVVYVYVAIEKKRMLGETSNPTPGGVTKFVESLVKSCRANPPSEDYTPLPKGPFKYSAVPNYDKKMENPEILVELAGEAIDNAISAGAKRVAGSLTAYADELTMVSTGSVEASERGTTILLNVRAFADSNASGHGLSCASSLADFDARGAGRTAGEYAKKALNPSTLPEGKYDVIMSPSVAADIFQHVGWAASAFSVESGYSFLADLLGKKVSVKKLSIDDVGVMQRGIGGRSFDDEGVPTGRTSIIDKGELKNYLHNSTTARKFSAKTTGNAGLIDPHPWNLEVAAGDSNVEEMIKSVKNGVFVTNNWYTRFQDPRSGAYSTVPRDAAFLIENGVVKNPIASIRISDSIPRQLSNIAAIGKERKWIKWWEVNVPTLSPAILVKDVPITKAVS